MIIGYTPPKKPAKVVEPELPMAPVQSAAQPEEAPAPEETAEDPQKPEQSADRKTRAKK